MSDIHRINVLNEQVAEDVALGVVRELTDISDASIECKIYYPYFKFDARCELPALLGNRKTVIPCLVDAIKNVAATADRIPVDSTPVPVESTLTSDHTVDKAERSARRYLQYHLGRRSRTIANFSLDLESQGIVHKAFWIVLTESTRFIVDTVTGQPQQLYWWS